MDARARLGEILLEAGEIDAAQLEAALRRQEETARPLGLLLVQMGALQEETLVRTLSQHLSLPMARLEGKRVGAEVLELVPFALAEKHRCFPLFVKDEGTGRALYLGMEDASDLDAIETLAGLTGMTIRPVLVAPSEIEEALGRQYPALASRTPAPLRAPKPEEPEEEGLELAGEDLQLDPDVEPEPHPDVEPAAVASGSTPDALDDSLADFAPELAVDAPGPRPVIREPEPPAPGPGPVSRDAILRALTQLLVEKGLIDREELIARVHRENGGEGT